MNFLERITSVYRSAGINEIMVVTNAEILAQIKDSGSPLLKDIKFILNVHPELGRFYSIKLGLRMVKQNSTVFLQNIDNPFISKESIAGLRNIIGPADYAVPEFEGRQGHPVLLSNRIANVISAQEDNEVNLRNILKSYWGKTMPNDDPGVLVNINTPVDYSKHFQKMKA